MAILTAMTKGNGDIDNATLREELEKEGLTVKQKETTYHGTYQMVNIFIE